MVNDISISFGSQYLEFHDYLDSICLDKDIGLSSSLFNFGNISITFVENSSEVIDGNKCQWQPGKFRYKRSIDFSSRNDYTHITFGERIDDGFSFTFHKIDNFLLEKIKSIFHFRYIITSSGAIAAGVLIFSLSNLFSLLQMVLGYYCRVDIRNNKIGILLD